MTNNRDEIIMQLVDDYEQYLSELSDAEIKQIIEGGVFTLSSITIST